jgi:hypothetical protein
MENLDAKAFEQRKRNTGEFFSVEAYTLLGLKTKLF